MNIREANLKMLRDAGWTEYEQTFRTRVKPVWVDPKTALVVELSEAVAIQKHRLGDPAHELPSNVERPKMSDPWRKRREYLEGHGWTTTYNETQHRYWWIDPKTKKEYTLRDGVRLQRERTDDFQGSVMAPRIEHHNPNRLRKGFPEPEAKPEKKLVGILSKEDKAYSSYAKYHGEPPLVAGVWVKGGYRDLRDMETLTY